MSRARAGQGTSPTDEPLRLFTRASSGLVREFNMFDAAWFGICAAGSLFVFLYLFPTPQFVSPGINIPLMLFLTLLYGVVIYFVYAALGSGMPRAGGDYLYESRALHPVVGFTIPWACEVLFWLAFPTAGAFVVSSIGLAPLASAFGGAGTAAWFDSKTGTFVVAAVVILACWALTAFGLRVYRIVHRYVVAPVIAVSFLTIMGVLLANLNTNFAGVFNSYTHSRPSHQAVVAAAAKAGFHASAFSLPSTLVWVAVLAGYIPYTMYSAQGMLGEVKRARSLWRLFSAYTWSGAVLALLLLALPFVLLSHIVGPVFLDRLAWAYGSGGLSLSVAPSIGLLISMLGHNAAITTLVAIGFIGGGFGIASAVYTNATRVILAMGMDGSLPPVFAEVSANRHTPVKGATIWGVAALAAAAAFSYEPGWEAIVLIGGAITSVIVVGVTCVAAAVFPYRSPEIYRATPVSRYRLGGLPLITVAGALGAAVTAALAVVALTNSALGLTSTTAHITIGVAFISGLIVYAGTLLLRQRRGVDISLAARYVPPE